MLFISFLLTISIWSMSDFFILGYSCYIGLQSQFRRNITPWIIILYAIWPDRVELVFATLSEVYFYQAIRIIMGILMAIKQYSAENMLRQMLSVYLLFLNSLFQQLLQLMILELFLSQDKWKTEYIALMAYQDKLH